MPRQAKKLNIKPAFTRAKGLNRPVNITDRPSVVIESEPVFILLAITTAIEAKPARNTLGQKPTVIKTAISIITVSTFNIHRFEDSTLTRVVKNIITVEK